MIFFLLQVKGPSGGFKPSIRGDSIQQSTLNSNDQNIFYRARSFARTLQKRRFQVHTVSRETLEDSPNLALQLAVSNWRCLIDS